MAYITIRLSQRQVLQLIEGQSITINISSAIPEVMSVDMLHMDNGPFHVSSGITFLQFFNKQILQLAENGCHRTTETYRCAYHKFACFRMQQDLTFDAIVSQLLVSFQSYLRQQNLSMNTISSICVSSVPSITRLWSRAWPSTVSHSAMSIRDRPRPTNGPSVSRSCERSGRSTCKTGDCSLPATCFSSVSIPGACRLSTSPI